MAVIDLDLNPDRKTLRVFGIAALLAFGALAAIGHFVWGFPGPVGIALVLLAAASGALAFVRPVWNLPLYRFLVVIFYPVGLVVSYVVLAVLFFGILTPVGLLFRLIGRDALKRRYDPKAASYWIPRSEQPELRRYFRPF
jgi:hypothetical protein